ncbi:hypothetical protein P3T18_005388 [Paraburkholderia sp. GAS199]|uniref:hypothetical protein n=1 Tax=Paraburkholderia sp. GAS199 TaxID=3035126 RepID=UPI003D1BF04F
MHQVSIGIVSDYIQNWKEIICPSTRSRRSERFSLVVCRVVERRYASIHQANLSADVGGGCAADATVGESAPASASSSSDDGDDDGGDPDSDPPALSPSEFARQSAAFRMTKTGVPGIRFDIPSASFRASYAPHGKPVRLGSFLSIDAAVLAIKAAYYAESGVPA